MSSSMESRIITFKEKKFFVGSIPIALLVEYADAKADIPCPVTVVDISNESSITTSMIQSKIYTLNGLQEDDVMCDLFLGRVLLRTAPGVEPVVLDDQSLQNSHFQEDLPCAGPYFVLDSKLYEAFRLFEDTCEAFVCGVVQLPTVPPSFEEGPPGYIPVPSRHYTHYDQNLDDLPLQGHRVAIKDIYDIRGVKTTAGSKAYEAMQTPATETADCVERLLRQGAIVVGKTKTVQFASGMTAADWEDYPAPVNPRGDKHLDPECSSAGSGASVAAYEWLDFAVGSDTLGSMTGPAAACGVFGLRPTQGLLSNIGGLPVSKFLDTPGHFTRSLPLLIEIGKPSLVELEQNVAKTVNIRSREGESCSVKPKRILIPEDCFEGYIPLKLMAMGVFCHDFRQTFNCSPITTKIGELWKLSKHNPEPSRSLKQFLSTTVATIQLYGCYHNNLPFRQGYKAKHGREPKVDKLIQYKWNLGEKLTESDFETACAERLAFRTFLRNEIFTEGTIMLLPNGDLDITYRDEPSLSDQDARRWQGFGFQNTAFSVLGSLPAVSVPIGERSYLSRVTGKYEKQPISMMVLGPPKSDGWLMGSIQAVFGTSKRPVEVKSGPSLW